MVRFATVSLAILSLVLMVSAPALAKLIGERHGLTPSLPKQGDLIEL